MAECVRISRWRLSQAISARTTVPTAGRVAGSSACHTIEPDFAAFVTQSGRCPVPAQPSAVSGLAAPAWVKDGCVECYAMAIGIDVDDRRRTGRTVHIS